jgi:hypothetical protein
MTTFDVRGTVVGETALAIKAPCLVATTGANITLSGVQAIDGVTVGNNSERVLVKDQADPTQNGIYIAATGNWVMAADFGNNNNVTFGTQVMVAGGSQNAGLTYVCTCTDSPIVIGASDITFLAEQLLDAQAQLATSSTAVAVAPGNVTFTTQSGKPFAVGQWLSIASRGNPQNYMAALVLSYSGTALSVYVALVNGSGTHSDWNIAVSGPPGPAGAANSYFYDTVTLAESATVPAGVNWIVTAGYATIGIGACRYKKVGSEPSDPRRFQTADGAWWQGTPANTIDLTMLGAGQGSQASDDAALAAAIAYANTLGGSSGGPSYIDIFYPDGQYIHGPCATALTVGQTAITGHSKEGVYITYAGSGGGTWLNIGSSSTGANVPTDVAIRNLVLDFGATPAASCVAFEMNNVTRVSLDDLYCKNFQTIAAIGTYGASNSAASVIYVNNIHGYSANGGKAAFLLNNGAGFYLTNGELYVAGAGLPTHGGTMTTVAGTNLINSYGAWDTVIVTGGEYERFYECFSIVASGAGYYSENFFVDNTICDYTRQYVFYMESDTGGVVAGFRVNNCWIVSWESDAIYLTGAGFNDEHDFSHNIIPIAGLCAFHHGCSNSLRNNFSHNYLTGINQVGTADSAIYLQYGGCSVIGNIGNDTEIGWSAPIGIHLGANADDYVVAENRVFGSANSIVGTTNTTASKHRRCHNNGYADAALFGGYAGVVEISLPGSGVAINNTTPFAWDFMALGANVTGVTVAGVTLTGAAAGTYRVEPGESITVVYGASTTMYVRTMA